MGAIALTDQKPSKSIRLNPQRRKVLEALVRGDKHGDIAERCGVAQETISRWIHQDPLFGAEYRRRSEALVDHGQAKLRSMVADAAETLRSVMAGGVEDGAGPMVAAAKLVLEGTKVIGAKDAPEARGGTQQTVIIMPAEDIAALVRKPEPKVIEGRATVSATVDLPEET